jgi:hypothetical protein
MWGPFGWFFASGIGIVGFVISVAIYFIPTIIAMARHHRNALAIFLLNFFFGWTFFGWIAALIWSVVR